MESAKLNSYFKDPKILNADTLEETKQLTIDFPWFQAGWLLYLKNLKNQNSPDYTATLKEVAVRVPDRKTLFNFLNSKLKHPKQVSESFYAEPSPYKLEGEVKIEEKNSLIDKFLSSEKKGGHKNFAVDEQSNESDKEDITANSSTTDDEIVTEMLASIYFQQKKYDEALHAYEKLSLKYPEKSVYFAARVKEIEDIKNNN